LPPRSSNSLKFLTPAGRLFSPDSGCRFTKIRLALFDNLMPEVFAKILSQYSRI